MRIKTLSDSTMLSTKKNTNSSTKLSGSSLGFASLLTEKQYVIMDYETEIAELKQNIDSAGDALEKEPTLDNFKKFRDLLGQFAKRITTEAYRLEKIGGTPQNPRYFEIIRIINTEADKLYSLILDQQRNRMAIIEKVIGIKGLVINLIT